MQRPTLPFSFFSVRGIATTAFGLSMIFGSGLACLVSLDGDDGLDSKPNDQFGEPCISGENNQIDSNNKCVCKIGFQWCNPMVLEDLNCCPIDGGTGTGTGTETTDATTMTGTGGTGDTGDTSTDTGEPSVHPEGPCTAEQEGASWCSHNEAMGPEGSRYYICTGGVWVDETAILDDDCRSNNFDFAYGCVATPTENKVSCGVGPGTPCQTADPDYCVEGDQDPPKTLAYCQYGRLTYQDCAPEPGQPCTVDGVDFEFGKCGLQEGKYACLCYDEDIGTESDTGTDTTDTSETGDTTGTTGDPSTSTGADTTTAL